MPRAVLSSVLFATGNDRADRVAVRAMPTGKLSLTGPAVYGPPNAVGKVLKGARMRADAKATESLQRMRNCGTGAFGWGGVVVVGAAVAIAVGFRCRATCREAALNSCACAHG
ncbi:DUF2000 family protein [Streptomyces sp. Ag109_O5-10]|uniref:DUF2000 family protein n=1 Tax=Streptomyces sp. Ag109_O5-10 TaxID=1855349 RepID=UPI0035251940